MAHAEHFLERLERIEHPEELSIALALYRDPALVRHILGRVKLSEATDRVALCLGPGEGPYVVLTRDGRFVTCLAEGMATGDLPKVARSHLYALIRESAEIRRGLDLAEDLAPGKRCYPSLVRRFHFAGPLLSREEFLALSAVATMRRSKLFEFAYENAKEIYSSHHLFVGLARRGVKGLDDKGLRLVEIIWQRCWAVGHFTLLSACHERDRHEKWLDEAQHRKEERALLEIPASYGLPGLTLRALRAFTEIGKPALWWLKHMYSTGSSVQDIQFATMGLVAMALHHSALKAEIGKLLEPSKAVPTGDASADAAAQVRNLCGRVASAVLAVADFEAIRVQALAAGRKCWLQLEEWFPASSPLRFGNADSVPEDLASAALAYSPGLAGAESENNEQLLAAFMTATAFLCRLEPHALYFPKEAIDAIHASGALPESGCEFESFLDAVDRHWVPPSASPVQVETRPGPNERCPCGSGKKFKRCHGAC